MVITFKNTVAAASIAVTSLFGSMAQAANIDLAFIMDSSGSVGQSNFEDAMDSLASALSNSIPVGGPDTYRIGVVSFGSGAVLTTFETISSQTDLDQVVADIQNQSYTAAGTGSTNYEAAFDLTVSTFGTLGDTSIVNMMTDGQPLSGNTADGLTGLVNAGWDSLSFESVGSGANNNFLQTLTFDTNGSGMGAILTDPNDITDPLNASFVLEVGSFGADYDAAIAAKVQRIVTPQVPLPAGLPLMLGGLAILGAISRRRSAAAA